ncbi:MAG: 23S rRNA (adenine(2503)-C(2))-methyltransferase RlmN [Oscillospiraceae bacterium]|nr:23S rRNA (adenine(2503)-C(2))-methyltransferase RlmN [Oscillospiraceae bacterium]
MEKIDILSLTMPELELHIQEIGEKKFRAKQIFQWLHVKHANSFDDMSNISLGLRTKLSEMFCIKQLNIERKLESSIDNTVKYLYRLSDGMFIETVLMEYNHGMSLCVSTQVGCKMGCRFCASTIAGFERNLLPSEILQQVYRTESDTGKKISGIVLMGIGEPLDNYKNVMRFLELVSCPDGYGLSLRHVTLSTCGIVPKIKELADKRLGLTLSVSLHCPENDGRSEIMPVNRTYNVYELIEATKEYIDKTGRRVTYEYAVIDGVNSDRENAYKLAMLIKGINCHVNLIPVNTVKEREYKSSRESALKFMNMLTEMGINATVRRTLGSDIDAACGQLRREAEKTNREIR